MPLPEQGRGVPITREDAQLSSPNLVVRQFARLDPAKTGDLARKAQLLNEILTGSLPGGLPGALIFGKPVASEVLARLKVYDADKVELSILLRPEGGVPLRQADEELKQTLSALAQNGVPQKTLKRVLKRNLRKLRRTYRYPERVARLAIDRIGQGAELLPLEAEAAALSAAAADDLNDLLRQILTSPVSVTGYNSPPSKKVN